MRGENKMSRLARICERCERRFVPGGKSTKLCTRCVNKVRYKPRKGKVTGIPYYRRIEV